MFTEDRWQEIAELKHPEPDEPGPPDAQLSLERVEERRAVLAPKRPGVETEQRAVQTSVHPITFLSRATPTNMRNRCASNSRTCRPSPEMR